MIIGLMMFFFAFANIDEIAKCSGGLFGECIYSFETRQRRKDTLFFQLYAIIAWWHIAYCLHHLWPDRIDTFTAYSISSTVSTLTYSILYTKARPEKERTIHPIERKK